MTSLPTSESGDRIATASLKDSLPTPVCWAGGAAHEKDPGADGEPLRYSVPWGDDNLEFAPSNPPQPDM